jgi:hypothetical protein
MYLISSKNVDYFSTMSNTVLSHMSKVFTSNKSVISLDKTSIIKFITNKSQEYDLKIGYDEEDIQESTNTKFLGLQIDKQLYWKNHIDLMVPKLSRACYAIRSVSHDSSRNLQINLFFLFSFHNEIQNNFLG